MTDLDPEHIKEEFKKKLSSVNADDLLQAVLNPETMGNLRSLEQEIPSDLRNLVRNEAMGSTGKTITRKLHQQGSSPMALKKKLKEAKKKQAAERKMKPDNEEPVVLRKVVLVHNRKLIQKTVPVSADPTHFASLIRSSRPGEVVSRMCYRAAIGPLEEDDLFVWFNSTDQSSDRVIELLTGDHLGTKAVFASNQGDLPVSKLQAVVDLLRNSS